MKARLASDKAEYPVATEPNSDIHVLSPDDAADDGNLSLAQQAKRYQEAIFGQSRADRDAKHVALVEAGRVDEMRADAEAHPITEREAVVRLPARSGGSRRRRGGEKKRGTRVCNTCHLEGCHCAKRGPKPQFPIKFAARIERDLADFISGSGGSEFVRALIAEFLPRVDAHNGFRFEQVSLPRCFIAGVGAPKMSMNAMRRVHWSVDAAVMDRLESLRTAAEARGSRFGVILRWLVVEYLQARLDRQLGADAWQPSSVLELHAVCGFFFLPKCAS